MSEIMEVEQQEPEPCYTEPELAALGKLIAERRAGEFLEREQSHAQIEKLIADKKKAYGL
jgi:antitoxin ParD1/3/4